MPSLNTLQRAANVIPGGVNSPVRAFKSVGGTPIFMQRGEGPYLFSNDQKRYIDYIGSWGPMILGHAHPDVIAAVHAAASKGLSFGTPTEQEIELAECVTRLMPSIEMLRCVSSGTEATMTAIRLARGFTGRNKIIKFEGCYHGHHDALLVKAGSGCLTFGTPSSAGIPLEVTQHTLTATFNNLEEVQQIFKTQGHEIAAIILEPIAGNMGCILPKPGFLEGLRALCDQHRSLLIFDEVMTGFRVALGGAQALYAIKPDLTTLGKIIGGGMPVGAVGGARAIMEHLSPLGPVYQAGTLSGNPIAMAAGLATLQLIQANGFHEKLHTTTKQLATEILNAAHDAKIPLQINRTTGMLSCFFTDQPVYSLSDVLQSNTKRFNQFFHLMLEENIHLPPSAFEAWFVSAAHSEKIIDQTITAIQKSFKHL